MNLEEYWSDFTSSERDMFQKACRRLLKSTFLVRDKDEDSRKIYYFVSKRTEPFSDYFAFMGFDIAIDRENGVIMLQNCADLGVNGKIQSNRLALKKVESIVLCCLWTIYAERLRSGSLSRSVMISVMDLNFELEKYGVRELIDNKKLITDILAMFSRFNLLDLRGKIGDPDCLIRLYPSLQFALDGAEFEKFVANVRSRMWEQDGEPQEDEEDDDADAEE